MDAKLPITSVMASVSHEHSRDDQLLDDAARADALARAEALAAEAATGVPIPPATVAEIIDEADRRGWSEVVTAALYVNVLTTWRSHGEEHLQAIEAVLGRAEAEADLASVANALALRARAMASFRDPARTLAADKDLSRATILAEAGQGSPRQLTRAHIQCGQAYAQRDLWELEDHHYQAALEIIETNHLGDLAPTTIAWNRAEAQMNWICALRELRDDEAIAHRAGLAAEALRAAQALALPDTWRNELPTFAALLGAIAPTVGGPDPQDVPASRLFPGYVHLARALSADDDARALEETTLAIDKIDPGTRTRAHSLALCLAAELEAKALGRETESLRYARHLAQLRWTARLTSLASMQSMLAAERLRPENDRLSRHVQLDDLTQLANRRGLNDYLEKLVTERVNRIALLLVDLDNFKTINDSHGHRAGDDTLTRFATTLRCAIRPGDLAIRLGGDEFAVVIPSIDADTARRRAQSILAEISTTPWEQISPDLCVAASIGIALGSPDQFDALIERADSALYRSKAAGGNELTTH
jgi:diguanylate cyclase (GGDEF)-like protein